MTPEQRQAALRLADYHDQFQLSDGKETADLLRALAAEPELKAEVSMHGKQAAPACPFCKPGVPCPMCIGEKQSVAEQDLADLIAGHCQTSRAHAYEMMQRALAERDGPVAEPVAWMDNGETGGHGQPTTRVVTAQTKAEMHKSTAAAYTVPLYTHPQDTALRVENARLKKRVEQLEQAHIKTLNESASYHVALRVENERLKAEVESLRAALKRIYFFQQDIGSPPLASVAEQMREIAHAALKEAA